VKQRREKMSKSGCPAEAKMYVIKIILVTPICTDNLTNYSSCCVKMSSPYNNGKHARLQQTLEICSK
jgi:hypothetical protein